MMTPSMIRYLVIAAFTVGGAAAVSGTSAYAQAGKRVSVFDPRPWRRHTLELVDLSRAGVQEAISLL